MTEQEMSAADADVVGQRVREALARRRMSRQALADKARVSLSTLEKALAGTRPFTLATTVRIEEALGIALRPTSLTPVARETAPEPMGAYARSAVTWLEGGYRTLRPSFGTPGAIYAYLTTIRWLDEGHLGFFESHRVDGQFAQTGHVSMPNLSGQIHLVTNHLGQYRLLTLSRPTRGGTMFGVLATLEVGHGAQLVPVATPVAMCRVADPEREAFGLITPESPHHAADRARLQTATGDDFVRLYPAV